MIRRHLFAPTLAKLLGGIAALFDQRAQRLFGFLIGPVVLSLVLSAIRIYRLDVLRMAVGGTPTVAPAEPEPSLTDSAA